tara:strand:- start:3669 stop:4121 length:453 start_codon:yes stop_codon:yes gene_type:complete
MADSGKTHESFSRDQTVKAPSERSFGIVFTVVFSIVGLIGLWPLFSDKPVRLWAWCAFAIAAAFLISAFLFPKILAPLNRAWMRFGLLLHKIINPLIMGLIFFVAVTPTALIMRALGNDPLQRKMDEDTDSYWIDRDPPGPDPDTMPHQF